MPAATDLRGGETTGVCGIRRAATPAVARPWTQLRTVENIEIVPPAGWSASMPLYMWFPEGYRRTPLADITALVNAVESRMLQLQAAARDRRDYGLDSTPNPIPMGIASSSPTPSTSDKKKNNANEASEKKRLKILMSIR